MRHNEGHHDQLKEDEMGREYGMRSVLVGKPGGKKLLGKCIRRWEDNIKIDLTEIR
jgi:hypothetical protein